MGKFCVHHIKMWNDRCGFHLGFGRTFLEQPHLSHILGYEKVPAVLSTKREGHPDRGSNKGRDSGMGVPLVWSRHIQRSQWLHWWMERVKSKRRARPMRWSFVRSSTEFRFYNKLLECYRGFSASVCHNYLCFKKQNNTLLFAHKFGLLTD